VHHAEHWWGTLAAYEEVWSSSRFRADLVVTVLVTLISSVVVLFMALGVALYLRMKGVWVATFLSGLAVVPLFIPVVIGSWAIITFYAADGFLRSIFAAFGLEGPTFGYTVVAIRDRFSMDFASVRGASDYVWHAIHPRRDDRGGT